MNITLSEVRVSSYYQCEFIHIYWRTRDIKYITNFNMIVKKINRFVGSFMGFLLLSYQLKVKFYSLHEI